MFFILLNILFIIIFLCFIYYKKIELENYILENVIFVCIFLEYGFFFIISYFVIYFFYFCLSKLNYLFTSFLVVFICLNCVVISSKKKVSSLNYMKKVTRNFIFKLRKLFIILFFVVIQKLGIISELSKKIFIFLNKYKIASNF